MMLHREERDIWRGKSDCDELLMSDVIVWSKSGSRISWESPAADLYHFLKMVDMLAIRKLRNMLGSMSRLPAWSSLSKDANDSEGMAAQLKVTI